MPDPAAILRAFCTICLLLLGATVAAADGAGVGQPRASSKLPLATETPEIGKVCGVRGKELGKLVEKGPGRWRLYDTAPGSMARRAFHLTGFSDGCPRRLIGAVAMFGSVELYELVHFGPVGMKPVGSATDIAYAKLRAGPCGKGACSARGISKLSRSAVFLNVYPTGGSAARLEVLMSKGKLAAVSKK